jgi:hypothetical protein
VAYFGFPFGMPFGKNSDYTKYFWNRSVPGGVISQIMSTWAQRYRLAIDGSVMPSSPVEPDVLTQLMGTLPDPTKNTHLISFVPSGDWEATPGVDLTVQQMIEEMARTDRLKLVITPVVTFSVENTQFSNVVLTGYRRFHNCRPIVGHRNWAGIDIIITSNGADHTIQLALDGVVMASGSISGNGAVTIVDTANSGLGCTLTLVYGADGTFPLIIVFPTSYKIHMQLGAAFVAGDFPRTAEATIADDCSMIYSYRSDVLAPGNWFIVIHQIPDNGTEATTAVNQSIVIDTIPAEAGQLTYVSGNSDATVVSYLASTTPGATYNFYDSEVSPSGAFNIELADYTHIAGAGVLTQTLPNIGANFTGYRGIWIQAVSGGIVDGGDNTLLLQYIDGEVVNIGVPPAPAVGKPSIVGRTITIPYSIDTRRDEFGRIILPAAVAVFLYQYPGSPDYTTPSAVAVVTVSPVGNLIVGNISVTAPGNGEWYFVLRSMAIDSTQSLNVNFNGPYILSLLPAGDPTFVVQEGS